MSRHKTPVPASKPEDVGASVMKSEPKADPVVVPKEEADAPVKQDALKSKQAVAPNDYSDWIFGGSFLAAGVFGVANAINHIRHNFYESFLKPQAGGKALNLSLPDAQANKLHPFAKFFRERNKQYEALSIAHAEGKITGIALGEQKIAATLKCEKLVDEFAQKEFGIATKGIRGWTTDVWKQRNHVGTFARRQATFTLATTTMVTLGAISTLKYARHLLDRIDENEKQQEAFLKQRDR